ncbi:MAG: hypothetical protein OXM61_11835 [Candidatus Poribacteria bacterium]|nr:hypothetical protein [Candidatus Poribacteria bacterium]
MAFEHNISFITTRIVNITYGTSGTGFFMQYTIDDKEKIGFMLLISNAHVFGKINSEIEFEINLKKNNESPNFDKRIKIDNIFVGSKRYYRHHDMDVDLACTLLPNKY